MVKINTLELENVKRIRAVKVEPAENGLTIIGGRNNQGKTSVLDSIAWALGGDRFRPSQAARDGSVVPPHLKIKLSNGIVVERSGKNSDLKAIDPDGRRAGQQLLNEFIDQLALDLPKFIQATNKEKAETLLKVIGVGDQLFALDQQETELYNQRCAIGQIADQKAKYAKEMAYFPDAPKDLVSVSELIRQQQDILAQNGENQRKRARAQQLEAEKQRLRRDLDELREKYDAVCRDCDIAGRDAIDLLDQSTEELERNIQNIETVNRKVRANLDKDKAEMDAAEYRRQYESLTAEIEQVRDERIDLLHRSQLPLPELSVEDGELTYQGKRWDNMSGSDQLKVAAAIVRTINSKCGFVLLDKLEQMDLDTLREFGAWAESEGLQCIATRVSTGGECSIIIEDGYASGSDAPVEQSAWKAGIF